MGVPETVHNLLFKRSSTFALTIIVGAFVFEACVDQGSKAIFESINKGKLWKDIKDNYGPKAD